MASFTSYDGTELAYRRLGSGPPLLCLPGGPGRTPEYFGDLGGLAAARELILLDLRGTGGSADADPATYRCDRMVGDVEALRAHLGLPRVALLGHSAAGSLAALYAAAHPDRISHLALITPDLQALGLSPAPGQERAAMARRSREPWYEAALAAVTKAEAGDESPATRNGYMPFLYGRWDAAAQAHAGIGISDRARPVQAAYYADGAFRPAGTRAALAGLSAPVLVYAGEADLGPAPELAAEAASLFPRGRVTVQPGAGHFPWIDDPGWFTRAMLSLLS